MPLWQDEVLDVNVEKEQLDLDGKLHHESPDDCR